MHAFVSTGPCMQVLDGVSIHDVSFACRYFTMFHLCASILFNIFGVTIHGEDLVVIYLWIIITISVFLTWLHTHSCKRSNMAGTAAPRFSERPEMGEDMLKRPNDSECCIGWRLRIHLGWLISLVLVDWIWWVDGFLTSFSLKKATLRQVCANLPLRLQSLITDTYSVRPSIRLESVGCPRFENLH